MNWKKSANLFLSMMLAFSTMMSDVTVYAEGEEETEEPVVEKVAETEETSEPEVTEIAAEEEEVSEEPEVTEEAAEEEEESEQIEIPVVNEELTEAEPAVNLSESEEAEEETEEENAYAAAYDPGFSVTKITVNPQAYRAEMVLEIDTDEQYINSLYVLYVPAADQIKLDGDSIGFWPARETGVMSTNVSGTFDEETGEVTYSAFLEGTEEGLFPDGLTANTEYAYRLACFDYAGGSEQYIYITDVSTFKTSEGITNPTAKIDGFNEVRLGYFSSKFSVNISNPNNDFIVESGLKTDKGDIYPLTESYMNTLPSTVQTVTPFIVVLTGNHQTQHIDGETYECNNPDFSQAVLTPDVKVEKTSFTYSLTINKVYDEEMWILIHYRQKGETEWINQSNYAEFNDAESISDDYFERTNATLHELVPGLAGNAEYEYYAEILTNNYSLHNMSNIVVWTDGTEEHPNTLMTGADQVLDESLFDPDFYGLLTEVLGNADGKLTVSKLEQVNRLYIRLDDSQTSYINDFMGIEATLFTNKPLKSLKGLEYLSNLRILQANDHDITAIPEIEKLNHLEQVSLHENCLTEMPDLSRLVNNESAPDMGSTNITRNLIDPLTVTPDKLPDWLANKDDKINYYREYQRDDTLTFQKSIYQENGKIPFEIYWAGRLSRSYELQLTINGQTIKCPFPYNAHYIDYISDLKELGLNLSPGTYDAEIKIVDNYGCTAKSEKTTITYAGNKIETESVALNKSTMTLGVGGKEQLKATIKPANATDMVRWGTYDEKIAVVDGEGNVTGISVGETKIYVISGYKSAVCTVKVVGPVKVKGVDVTETLTLRPGKTEALKVTITPDDATNKNVTFESSDTAVATVDAEGNVTAVSEGTAVITVTTVDGSFKDECAVTVVGAEPAEAPKAYYYVNGALSELTADVRLSKGDQIVLKSATNGAAVYYTTDGSEPTAESTLYTEPIVFSGKGELQIRAIAVKEGYKNSEAFEIKVQAVSDSWEDDPGDVTEEDAAAVDYEIPKQIWFAGVPESVEYTGKKITISTLRVYDHKTLLTTKDYKAVYTNNLNAGTATITVTGKGNYQKSVSQTFEITPRNFEDTVADDLAVMETGSVLTPKPVVKYGSTTLKLNKDYTVAEKDGKTLQSPDKYTLVLTGLVNYSGTKEINYTIGKKTETVLMSKAKVTPEIKTAVYTGEEISPSVTVKVGTAELTEGTDYDVTYRNNTEVGTATIVVTGKGSYAGVKTATFKITGTSLNKAVTVTASPQVYTGEELKPAVITSIAGDELTEGTDYEVAYTKNTNAGTATVTVTGKGRYTGTVRKTFKITARNILETEFSVSDAEYAAKGAIPAVKVTYQGKTLKSGKDYTESFPDM